MTAHPIPRVLAAALLLAAIGKAEFPAAQSRQILPTTYYNTFSHANAVLARIRPGDTVSTRTIDASGHDEKGEARASAPNPLTGPFYVEGAEPGDALAVRFTRMRMNRNWGFSNYRLGLYALTPESIESLYPNRYRPDEIIKGRASVVPWDLDLDPRPLWRAMRLGFAKSCPACGRAAASSRRPRSWREAGTGRLRGGCGARAPPSGRRSGLLRCRRSFTARS